MIDASELRRRLEDANAALDLLLKDIEEFERKHAYFDKVRQRNGSITLKEFKAKVEKMPHAKQLLSAEDYEAYQAESDAIHQEFWAAKPHTEVEAK